MKKNIVLALAMLSLAFSCKEQKDLGPAPTSIDKTTLSASPEYVVRSILYTKDNPWTNGKPCYKLVEKGGTVVLRWAIPKNCNYERVEVTYKINDVLVKEDRMRAASSFDSEYVDLDQDKEVKKLDKGYTRLVIDNLKARYGKITFFVTPISRSGARGETISIVSEAKPLGLRPELKTDSRVREDIDPKTELWADSQEESEGPLKDLVDGTKKVVDGKEIWTPNTSTYFHMNWKSPTPFPHYIVVKLDKPAVGVSFDYIGRDHGGNLNPKTVQVWGSTSFNGKFEKADGSDKFNPADFGAKTIGPEQVFAAEGKLAKGSSDLLAMGDEQASYIWIEFKDCIKDGEKFLALSNLNVYTYEVKWTDPEREGLTKAQIDQLVAKKLLRTQAEIDELEKKLSGK